MSKVSGCAGSVLLLLGALALLYLCSIAFRVAGQSDTPTQAGVTVTFTLALMAGVAVVFIIPGLLLLLLGGKRKPSN